MNTIFLIILLQLIAIVIIITEVFIPSFGLLAIIALGTMGYSLYLVFLNFSPTLGLAIACADVAVVFLLVMIGLKLVARSPLSLRKKLSNNSGVVSQSERLAGFLHREGVAVTDLRPAGIALIEDQRVDVVTDGEYIEKDTRVKVTIVTGNQVIVETIN